jgi:hypothetical protein
VEHRDDRAHRFPSAQLRHPGADADGDMYRILAVELRPRAVDHPRPRGDALASCTCARATVRARGELELPRTCERSALAVFSLRLRRHHANECGSMVARDKLAARVRCGGELSIARDASQCRWSAWRCMAGVCGGSWRIAES